MSQAYQQLTLDEDSKKLLVVNTPKGLFRYTRLLYGVSTAPAIFQSVMDRILQGLPVACYLDDNYTHSKKTEQEHYHLLEQTLERLENAGIRLKQEKCEFYGRELQYLGHRINATGIHPMEEKVKAIKDAPRPENVSQLKSFYHHKDQLSTDQGCLLWGLRVIITYIPSYTVGIESSIRGHHVYRGVWMPVI